MLSAVSHFLASHTSLDHVATISLHLLPSSISWKVSQELNFNSMEAFLLGQVKSKPKASSKAGKEVSSKPNRQVPWVEK